MIERDPLSALVRLAASEDPTDPVVRRRSERTREAVHAEWRGVVRARRLRRIGASGFVATLAALALVFVGVRAPSPETATVLGETVVVRGSLLGPTGPLNPGAVVPQSSGLRVEGDENGTGGAALLLPGDLAVRLGPGTTAVLEDARTLRLDAGSLYVDAPPRSDARPLTVRTPWGAATNVATQFEIRVDERELRLRVREGEVRLSTAKEQVSAEAGTEISLDAGGLESRRVPVDGEPWRRWEALAVFDVDGATLGDLVDWVERETGLEVAWVDDPLRRRSRAIVLRGSIGDLPPRRALRAVLPTCSLRLVGDASGGRLLIGPSVSGDSARETT